MRNVLQGWRPLGGIVLLVLVLIGPDMGTMVGTDFSYYLDLSDYIHRGGMLFRDYVEYRLPVFSLLVSPLLGLFHNDVALRLFVSSCVYVFYGMTVYLSALHVMRVSKVAALAGAAAAVVTVMARGFDPGRNIVMPLFHETASLVSMALIICGLGAGVGDSVRRHLLRGVFGGAACAVGFLGRQVGVMPGLLMIGLLVCLALPGFWNTAQRRAVFLAWLSFPAGFVLAALLLIGAFWWSNPSFLQGAVLWFLTYPSHVYAAEGVRAHFTAPFALLMEFYAIAPWALWLALIALVTRQVLRARAVVPPLRREEFALPVLIGIGYFLVPAMIGRHIGIYQVPAVSFFALLVCLLVNNVPWRAFWRTAVLPAIAVSPLLLGAAITEARGVYAGIKGIRQPQAVFTNRLAEAVKAAMAQSGPDVLNLGGYSSVGRLADYRPFEGLTLDCLVYEAPLFLPPRQVADLSARLDRLDVMYGYMDTPCVSGAVASPELKAYFSTNFRVFRYVTPELSYPYNYAKPMVVYIRKAIPSADAQYKGPAAGR